MKTLVVGDPHLQHSKLDDAGKFLDLLRELSSDHDQLLLLGDLFHTFAIIRSEVLSLWNSFFCEMAPKKIISLVGNHDYASQAGGNHALEVFKDKILVVDQLQNIDGVYFLPFIRDRDEFVSRCRSIPSRAILVCHQSFMGVHFAGGFSDPEGIDPECVAHLTAVISGHIHNAQSFKNIWYPGTPFQHSFGEAGEEKRVYTIDLSASCYSIIRDHDLDLPKFEVIEAKRMSDLVLPKLNPNTSYKIVAAGSPSEIQGFWNTPEAKDFKAQAKRLVDACVAERGEINLPGMTGSTQRDKLEQFIRSKKWRTAPDRLLISASTLIN